MSAPAAVSLFETTIRIVGGLLAAHHLCSESHPALSRGLGHKAVALGERLLPAFTASPSGGLPTGRGCGCGGGCKGCWVGNRFGKRGWARAGQLSMLSRGWCYAPPDSDRWVSCFFP